MMPRLYELLESMTWRDLVEIGFLTLLIYAVLRFLGATRGAGAVRGIGLVGFGLFLVAQLLIDRFDLTELGKLLDYLITTALVGFLVIFQPELRRGLMMLGRYRGLGLFQDDSPSVAGRLAGLLVALSRDRVGALLAIQREQSLAAFIETGERLDAECSPALLRAIFSHQSPLHDGAVIVVGNRIAAAGCQLPLAQPNLDGMRTGMRHRAALGLSEETDAILLVVSEETGRISVARAGRLEPIPREDVATRLEAELSSEDPVATKRPLRRRSAATMIAPLQIPEGPAA